ncbi:hypothetical protein L9F63_004269 [Diploptera punctata]|uniref:Major facilitator superfamily (MFS) profile domain-containing protein n=1 Tax=Diploptera punctata TaxID=6984 RepID=A0AAD8E833_DIPPU|nr:hypothetical protein L9F63_004269 [Diploptera punctata]
MESKATVVATTPQEKVEWKLYHKRWFILFIFVCFEVGNNIQWIQYSIIARLIILYYDVSESAVDWTSMIFMVIFIPVVFPASHFIEKVGLRWPMIIGTFATAAGACIKIGSVDRDLFWVTFIGQTFAAIGQVFMLSIPPIIAAIWFGEKEVSTACSIGIFGNQLGIILGFFIPPMMVKDHSNVEDIGNDLRSVFYLIAGFNVAVFILTLIFFQNKPPMPPSPQQAMQKQNAAENDAGFFKVIKRLLLNKSYVLLVIGYCINQSVLNAVGTLLNQIVTQYSYEDSEEFGGRIGATVVAAGLVGSIAFGIILDKTRKYRLVTFIVYALSFLGMVAVTYTLPTKSEAAVYSTSAIFGFFLVAYMSIAYDLAVEVTYPEPESMSAGLITFTFQLVSWLATLGYGEMVRNVGAEWSNNTLSIALLIGTIIHAIFNPDLKRQAAVTSSTSSKEV